LQCGVDALPAQSLSVWQLPLPRTTQVSWGEHCEVAGQSVSVRHCTQVLVVPWQMGRGLPQSTFEWHRGGATHLWDASQIGFEPSLQSALCRHWTHAFWAASQTGNEEVQQSWSFVQPGCAWHELSWHSLPCPQSCARRHSTQAPFDVSQIRVDGRETQSSSAWHPLLPVDRQHPLVHLRPTPHSTSPAHAAESGPQPELAHLAARQRSGAGQSRSALHSPPRPLPHAAKSAPARSAKPSSGRRASMAAWSAISLPRIDRSLPEDAISLWNQTASAAVASASSSSLETT
jgi:hypothetical protein